MDSVLINHLIQQLTGCPRSLDQFYIVSYYIKRVTTSWTYGTFNLSFGKNLLLASSYKFLDKQYF